MTEIYYRRAAILEPSQHLRDAITFFVRDMGLVSVHVTDENHLISEILHKSLRPSVMFLPVIEHQIVGIQISMRIEAELGYCPPWISLVGDVGHLQQTRETLHNGTLIEMPCPRHSLETSLKNALDQRAEYLSA